MSFLQAVAEAQRAAAEAQQAAGSTRDAQAAAASLQEQVAGMQRQLQVGASCILGLCPLQFLPVRLRLSRLTTPHQVSFCIPST